MRTSRRCKIIEQQRGLSSFFAGFGVFARSLGLVAFDDICLAYNVLLLACLATCAAGHIMSLHVGAMRVVSEEEELFKRLDQAFSSSDARALRALRDQVTPGSRWRSFLENPLEGRMATLSAEEQSLSSKGQEQAQTRHFTRRLKNLHSVLRIFTPAGDGELGETVALLVRDLCTWGTIKNLIDVAKLLVADVRLGFVFYEGFRGAFINKLHEERKALALCLFFACQHVQITEDEIKGMVDVLKQAQLRLLEVEGALDSPSFPMANATLEATTRDQVNEFCYLILMAIAHATLPHSVKTRNQTQEVNNPLVESTTFHDYIRTMLDNPSAAWSPHASREAKDEKLPYEAMLAIPLALADVRFCRDRPPASLPGGNREADDARAWRNLEHAAPAFRYVAELAFVAETWIQDPCRQEYHNLWNQVCKEVVVGTWKPLMDADLLDFKQFCTKQSEPTGHQGFMSRQSMEGGKACLRPFRLTQLLKVIGLVHKDTKGAFWDQWAHLFDEEDLWRSLRYIYLKFKEAEEQHLARQHQAFIGNAMEPSYYDRAGDNETRVASVEEFEITFLDMLTGMVETGSIATKIFAALHDRNDRYGWQRYSEQLAQDCWQSSSGGGEGLRVPREEFDAAILRLQGNMVRYSNAVLIPMRAQGMLQRLKDLLMIPNLSPHLVGQVFETIACCCVTSADSDLDPRAEIALDVWKHLDSPLNVLKGDKDMPSNGGNIEEDYNIELHKGKFPETIGFLQLVGAILPHLATPAADYELNWPSFGPYLKFVAVKVFPQIMAQRHVEEREKWELGAGCLSIMANVLSYCEPDRAHCVKSFDIGRSSCTPEEDPPRDRGWSTNAAQPRTPNLVLCGHWLMSELMQGKELLLEVRVPAPPDRRAEKACWGLWATCSADIIAAVCCQQCPVVLPLNRPRATPWLPQQ